METTTGYGTSLSESRSDSADYVWRLEDLPYRHVYVSAMDIVAPASMLVLLLGLVFNAINITVFIKMSAKDTVTVSLLLLSISDLSYLAFTSINYTIIFVDYMFDYRRDINVEWGFDKNALRYPFQWYASTFYETSTLITVYMSVVRCACVAMPLKFKMSFTVSRTVITCGAFLATSVLLRIPVYMTHQIRTAFNPATNRTELVYYEYDDGGFADTMYDIVNWNMIPFTSFIIVSLSTLILGYKLLASVKFRKIASSTTENTAVSVKEDVFTVDQQSQTSSETRPIQKSSVKGDNRAMSSKEANLVRSVVLIAVVFIACQIPYVVNSVVRRIDARFDYAEYKEYRIIFPLHMYLYASAQAISRLFGFVNASFNIVVYFFVNSKYKQQLLGLCCRKGNKYKESTKF